MRTRLAIVSGARAGEALVFSQPTIFVGRHPDVDLRFDPDIERGVSAKHALLFLNEGRWLLRDLGSRNGTLVNGRLVKGDVILDDGDRVTFGVDGPTVEFTRLDAAPVVEHKQAGEATVLLERVRSSRAAAAFAIAASSIVVVVVAVIGSRREAAWDLERNAMQLQIDSLEWATARTVEALELQLREVTSSLQRSQGRVQDLEFALRTAEARGAAGADDVARLQRELRAALTALQGQQSAAGLDFRAIQDRNRNAVARVFVEYESGQVIAATAFSVRSDATLLTSRHVLTGEDGEQRARRIAVQFSDSEQVWPARVLAASAGADLAAVKVDNILGAAPTVQGFNIRPDTLPGRAPVAMLGFPLGGAPPAEGREDVARPFLAAGTIRSVGAEQLEVEGYGAVGASGSPIFDASGDVIAIVFGGRSEDDGHTLFAVPSPVVYRFLQALP